MTSRASISTIKQISLDQIDDDLLTDSAAQVKEGKFIISPTDTCYGIVADGLNKESIREIYQIRKRSFSRALYICVLDVEMAEEIAFIDERARKLWQAFPDHLLSIVVKRKETLPDMPAAHLEGVSLRIPINPILRSILEKAGTPLAVSTATQPGKKIPYSIDEILQQWTEQDLSTFSTILDAGELDRTLQPTVIDLSSTLTKVVRLGPLKKSQIMAAIQE